jgi:hypothetical protein
MVTRVTVFEQNISNAFWPGGTIYENTRRIGKYNEALAYGMCPVRSGDMLNSMEFFILPRGRYSHFYTISVDVPYANYVIDGTTGPIRAKAGKYLWMRPMPHSRLPFNITPGSRGRWPFKSVSGQDANPFLQRSLRQTMYDMGII